MPVHDSLVSALSSVAKDLLSDLRAAREFLGNIKEVNVFELKTTPARVPDVSASDSSWTLKGYSMVLVYAIQAVAVRASASEPSSPRRSVEADAGYFIPSLRASDIAADEVVLRAVQFMSKNLEVASLASISDGVEIALFDGSLFSFLWYSKFPEIPQNLKSLRGRPSKLRDVWRSTVGTISSIARSGTAPMFVSKSIRRSYYIEKLLDAEALERVGSRVNDLMILGLLKAGGRLPRKAFVLEPVYITSFSELPRPLNSLDREDRQIVEPLVPITVTYVSFNPAVQPYQVTVPGLWDPEELVDLASAIYPYSHSGYPDPLRIAHGLCKIGSRELRYLLLKLGISSIPTGRELLGDFA